MCCRSRQDIKCAVAFLTIHVKDSDKDDWKKLIPLLCYLNGTKNLVLTIDAHELLNPKWWDMKSHTGGIMMFGKGSVQSISQKQKLNMKSLMEAEVVGADSCLGDLLWTRNLLHEQGYKSEQTILYQDKTSVILLERVCQKTLETH